MTDWLERAVRTARGLSENMQEEIARMMLACAGVEERPVALTADERAEQDAADLKEARGDHASDEDVRAIWAKHGL